MAITVAAAALPIAGCGGDESTTTVTVPGSTVTTTVASAPPAQKKQSGGQKDEARPQRQRQEQTSEQPNAPRPHATRSPNAEQARKRFFEQARKGNHPILDCIRRYGSFGEGSAPQPGSAPNPKLRKCIRSKIGNGAGARFGQ